LSANWVAPARNAVASAGVGADADERGAGVQATVTASRAPEQVCEIRGIMRK
jgi:hypothetical protein